MDWNTNLKQLMGEATQLVRSGNLNDATRAIQRALGGAGAPAAPEGTAVTPATDAPASAPASRWRPAGVRADVQDAVVIDRSGGASSSRSSGSSGANSATDPTNATTTQGAHNTGAPRAASSSATATKAAPAEPSTARRTAHPLAEAPGSFTRVTFTQPGALGKAHHYHLYVPPSATAGTPMPLVVMLHGCTQNPVDFATGTGMNAAAAPANALVLYPEQPHSANPNGCWNWFRPEDQSRESGEPAMLVAMVRDVMARHTVDAQRVYVAGLSAGGAMAALLGREYPDVFAAVGVHSGLQAGAAHNTMAALSAMKNGAKTVSRSARKLPTAHTDQTPALIVFHGDADATVHAKNGEQLVQAALSAVPGGARQTQQQTHQGASPAGQPYIRTVYRNANAVVAEHWVLHGAGHAWSGGAPRGSHTDARGVSATQEMLRFFLEHRHAR